MYISGVERTRVLNWRVCGTDGFCCGTEGFPVWNRGILVLNWGILGAEKVWSSCETDVLNWGGLCGTEGYSFPGEGLRNKETKFSRFHKNVKIHVKCETIVFFSPLDCCQRNFSESFFGRKEIFSTPENDKKNSEYSTCTHIRKFRILYWIFGSNLVKMDLREKNFFLEAWD